MLHRGDDRAVTVQIGAVLLLAILFAALTLYQLNAVPTENQQVEYTHNQEVRDEMQDLRNAIQNVGTGGGTQSTAVTLGTQYPSRTVAVNPPTARGTLETTGTANISVNGQFAGEKSDYDGNPHNLTGDHETTTLAYTPKYNEYQSAPTTRIEHGFAFDDFDDAQVSLTDQPLVSNDTIRLVTLEGDLSESGTGAVSLDPTALSGPSDEVPIEGEDGENITVTIPTAAPTAWNETVGTTFDTGESDVRTTTYDDANETLTVELANAKYDLQVARVAVGEGGSSNDDYDIRAESETSGESRYDVWWDHQQRTYEPGNAVELTASVDNDLREAAVDFSYKDPDAAVDGATYNQRSETFEDGEATVEFEIDSEADDGDEVDVFVSSAGTTRVLTVTVVEDRPDVESVDFTLEDSEITVGETTDSTVEVTYEDGTTETVTADEYETSDAAIATIDDSGVVTGEGEGEATLTATVDGESDTANVTVTEDEETEADGVYAVAEDDLDNNEEISGSFTLETSEDTYEFEVEIDDAPGGGGGGSAGGSWDAKQVTVDSEILELTTEAADDIAVELNTRDLLTEANYEGGDTSGLEAIRDELDDDATTSNEDWDDGNVPLEVSLTEE